MNKLKIIATITSFTAVVSLLLNLGLTNTIAVDGFSLSYLSQEVESLTEYNQELTNQIASLSSPTNLKTWASSQGYTKVASISYLNTTSQVALLPANN